MNPLFHALHTSPPTDSWPPLATAARFTADPTRQYYCDLFDFAPIAYLVTDMMGCIHGANQAASLLLGVPSPQLAQKSLLEFVAPAEQAKFCAQLASLHEAPGSQDWAVVLQPVQGPGLPVQVSVIVVRDGQGRARGLRWLIWVVAPPATAASTPDSLPTERAYATVFLAAIHHAVTCIKTMRDPEQVLNELRTELQLLNLQCCIALLDAETNTLVVRQVSIAPETRRAVEQLLGGPVLGHHIPVEHFGAYAEMVQQRRPLYFTEATAAILPLLPALPPTALTLVCQLLGLTPAARVVYVPLGGEDHVLGVVVLWGESLREADLWALSIFTTHVTTTLDNVRLGQELKAQQAQLHTLSQQLVEAMEAERGRIARELHDEAGQLLYGLHLRLDALANNLPAQPLAAFLPHLEAMRELVEKARCKIRNLSHELRPAPLDELGLVLALRWLVNDFSCGTGLLVVLEAEEVPAHLPQAVEAACYRIVQEAFTNIVRHAQAHHVRVHLHAEAAYIHLQIEDDGCGFDPRRVRAKGIGLLGIQERAISLNGQVLICSAPGQGTRLEVRLPSHLPPAQEDVHAHFTGR